MAGNKLRVRAQKALDLLHHTALYAAHIHKQRAGLEVLLVVSKPIHQRVRIQAQHHRIGPCQQRRKVLHRARGDDALFQRVTDGLGPHIHSRDGIPGARQAHGVAASQEPQAHDADIALFIHPSVPPFRPVRGPFQKSPASSCLPPPPPPDGGGTPGRIRGHGQRHHHTVVVVAV